MPLIGQNLEAENLRREVFLGQARSTDISHDVLTVTTSFGWRKRGIGNETGRSYKHHKRLVQRYDCLMTPIVRPEQVSKLYHSSILLSTCHADLG